MIEGPPHTSIKEPMDMARKSCAMNMEIRRKETALPFVSLEWGQGQERSVPESWNGIQTMMMVFLLFNMYRNTNKFVQLMFVWTE